MQIRVGTLRKLIREMGTTSSKTSRIVNDVVTVATAYVDSVVAGSPDKRAATELKTHADEAASYAKWLIGRREPGSDSVGMVAKYALDLAELAQFWKRPTFMGKTEYLDQLKTLLARLQKSQMQTMAA